MTETPAPSGQGRLWLGASPPPREDAAPVRIAPGLGLHWTGETLRAVVPGQEPARPATARSRRRHEPESRRSRGRRRRAEPARPLGAAEAERLAVEALEREDAAALAALETRLTTAHHGVHARAQRPVVEPSPQLTADDAREARDTAMIAAAGIEHRRERRSAKARSNRARDRLDPASVDAFLASGRIAARVRDSYRQAAADMTWRGLEAHDATAVIAALDASFAAAQSDCTCIDAGRAGPDRRAYVTVLCRVPGIEVVPDRGPGAAATGRPMLRRRTADQREQTYRAVLASTTLAAVNHVLGAAIATDDVNVVLVRPALPSATDLQARGARRPRLDALHVARLSREEVTLRPVDADPVLTVFGGADPGSLLEPDETTVLAADGGALRDLVEAVNRALSG